MSFRKTCKHKQSFDTAEQAEKAMPKRRYDYMQVYKCRKKDCGKYHFGHIGVKQWVFLGKKSTKGPKRKTGFKHG